MRRKPAFLAVLSTVLALPLTLSLAASSARADDSGDSGQASTSEHGWHHHHTPWAFSISPRYYGLNTSGYSSAFTGAGFSAPKSGTVGVDFSFYWTTKTDWELGFGGGNVGYTSDLGSSEASYNQSIFGFWVGKRIPLCQDWDLSVGSLFAGGDAQVEVLSSSANGKTEESSFILEPKIVAAYRAADWFKIGASATYVEPLAQSDTVHGTNLTPGNISQHGFSGGVEFIFGRFDRE